MTVYLVDFENVRSSGLKGVENLSDDDKVVIFYSKNADAITFDVHMLLSKSMAEIETYMILRGGRNSLDFQLSTYLGYLVMENRFRNIVIISEDKGFLCAINFWEENMELCNANIRLAKSIESFESDDLADELEDSEGSFIKKLSVIPAKNSTSEIKETLKLNSKEANKSSKQKFENFTEKAIKKAKAVFAPKSSDNKENSGNENDNKPEENIKDASANNKKKTERKPKNNKNGKRGDKNHEDNKKPQNNRDSKKQYNANKNVQNLISKNKMFAAEVKYNIVEDVRNIIGEKYGEEYVPVLVEAIGKSTGKQHLYRMLVSRCGQELGKELYVSIKGQYVNLKRK